MVVPPPSISTSHAIERALSLQVQSAVLRLASKADRARASGRADEADSLLLQAWAALDG
jgi:hypothetical protein